ncbi:uncharacterized protein LOC123307845 [Coccinella septempunctata]|uniref:uncharacterized protein LOC123307845 n=1 Tax=Coccinella septempunctata TaxID=41139 RepID=UPI001D09716B|nr:uncharacterized protein LOC123307845 [Coccinella septempunctata]
MSGRIVVDLRACMVFSSKARSWYLLSFSVNALEMLSSAGIVTSMIMAVLSLLLNSTRSGLLCGLGWVGIYTDLPPPLPNLFSLLGPDGIFSPWHCASPYILEAPEWNTMR